jgi:hypothetical protein
MIGIPLIGIALTLNFNTAAADEINFTQQTQQQKKTYSQILGIQRRKRQTIHGGSYHALDTMLKSEMQNKRKTKTARVPIIFE